MGRDLEACREIAPEVGLIGRQHHDDRCAGERFGEAVDGACQHGHTVQQQKLFGPCGPHAAACAAGYDDDASLSWFHMSFVPNPSVLSVYFKNVGRSRHRVSVVSAA